MLTIDSEKAQTHKKISRVEQQLQDRINWMKEQEKDTIYVENELIDISNNERQLGRPFLPSELEKRLKKVNPNFHFEVNWRNNEMKALYFIKNGKKEYIGSYHNCLMPEHSVSKVKYELVWDYKATQKPLERKDLPKHEWVPGKGWVFDPNAPRPGWKVLKKPNGEYKRGWRTLLIMIVLKGYAQWWEIDKVFKETPSSLFGQRAWAYHRGDRSPEETMVPF